MNRNIIVYLLEFVVTQMNHWVLFPLFLMPVCLMQNLGMGGSPNILFWAAMGIIPFVFYLLRRNLSHLGLLAVSHLAVFIVFVCLLYAIVDSGKALYLLFGMGYGIYSLYRRLYRKNLQDTEFFMPLAVGFFLLSSVFAHYLGCLSWDFYYTFALVGVLGLYFIHSYLSSYLKFVVLNERSTGHIPEREIFASGSRLVLLFTAGSMSVLLLLSNLEWLRGILNVFKAVFLSVMRFIFSLIPMGNLEDAPQIMPSAPEPVKEDFYGISETGEPFFLWDVLLGILVTALFCGILYGFFLALKRFILFIKSRIHYKTDNNVRKLGYVSDIREKCPVKQKSHDIIFKKVSFWESLSPGERIRRLYKKHILEAKMISGNHNKKPPGFFTAREWGLFLGEANMADVYEKARYSAEICTAEDVRRMKEALKGHYRASNMP